MGVGGQMISIHPEELTFGLELEKPSYCNLKVINNTEHHVAFKVKTTAPKKYFVRPNTSVVQPWDSSTVVVTLQPQKEYPPDMQCKDKFLIQSAKVPPISDMDEIPDDTFSKEDGKVIDEHKLKVVYRSPAQSGHGNTEGESGLASAATGIRGSDMMNNSSFEEVETEDSIFEDGWSEQDLAIIVEAENIVFKEIEGNPSITTFEGRKECNSSAKSSVPKRIGLYLLLAIPSMLMLQNIEKSETLRLYASDFMYLDQAELKFFSDEILKKRRSHKGDAGFSLAFTAFAGLIGILVGFILNLTLSTPSSG
ncbi:hypothetical protein ZIOFF_060639 [Zingiber officinale]|uniref:MSP domain-containing protein n=1 Tax=Zingiber officinale TaxID=94328 RepID=A0A8J5FBV2_ZINOF|nr:hypothetical protein ZIOFF_060639 [Zingiber officinale]